MPPYSPLPETIIPGDTLGHAAHHQILHKYYNAVGNKTFIEAKDVETTIVGTALSSPIVNMFRRPKIDASLPSAGLADYIGPRELYTPSGNTGVYQASADSPTGNYVNFSVGSAATDATSALFITKTSTGNSPETPTVDSVAVVPGDTITISILGRTTGRTGNTPDKARFDIRWLWRDNTGAPIGSFSTVANIYLTSDWRRYIVTTSAAPANAAYVSLNIEIRHANSPIIAGEQIHITGGFAAKNFSAALVPTVYWDGDSVGAHWDGPEQISKSIMTNLSRFNAGEFYTQGYANMVLVNHGSVASTPRPLGLPAGAVYWVGTVMPTNADALDIKRISGTLS